MTTIGFGDLYPTTFIAKMVTTTIIYLGAAFWCLPGGIIGSVNILLLLFLFHYFIILIFFSVSNFKGLAIKVQEQKRDEAFSNLIPAAASVIRNWWRLRCAHEGNRFVATWRIYKLAQRRIHVPITSSISHDSDTDSYTIPQKNLRSRSKLNNIGKKSIKTVEDLPKRYVTAIKILRILKYSAACKKFYQAKHPVNLKEVVKENTQVNNRLSTMLNDIHRRLDLTLGTKKLASYLPDHEKHQLCLSSRIENAEHLVHELETKLNYLEHLVVTIHANK